MNENFYWQLIEQMNWKKTKDYNTCNDFIIENYPHYYKELLNFVKSKRLQLKKYLLYYKKFFKNKDLFGISNDNFWDLTADIVGCGKKLYYNVFRNPMIAVRINNKQLHKENFQYSLSEIKLLIKKDKYKRCLRRELIKKKINKIKRTKNSCH